MKVVVQASGGIESTTLIAKAIADFGHQNVYPIAFNTGSVFWKHRDSIAVKRVLTNFQLQAQAFICNMPQTDMLEYVRDADYADVGFIPGFKLMFNIASMSWAQRSGAHKVWIGNMKDNVFPDESPDFLQSVGAIFNRTYVDLEKLSDGEHIRLETPFSAMTKGEVIDLGYSLMGEKLFDTVSCGDERVAGGFNCGVCPWCVKRREGFTASSVTDKTHYLFG